MRSVLLNSWRGMTLASISVFVGMLWCFVWVCVTVEGLVWSNFLCPQGQWFIVAIYACAFTCARSFTVLSVQGVLLRSGVF